MREKSALRPCFAEPLDAEPPPPRPALRPAELSASAPSALSRAVGELQHRPGSSVSLGGPREPAMKPRPFAVMRSPGRKVWVAQLHCPVPPSR